MYRTRERKCENNLKIEYSKKTVKYINSVDKPTKRRLRVLFSIEDDTIYIDNIIPRGQAYKRI